MRLARLENEISCFKYFRTGRSMRRLACPANPGVAAPNAAGNRKSEKTRADRQGRPTHVLKFARSGAPGRSCNRIHVHAPRGQARRMHGRQCCTRAEARLRRARATPATPKKRRDNREQERPIGWAWQTCQQPQRPERRCFCPRLVNPTTMSLRRPLPVDPACIGPCLDGPTFRNQIDNGQIVEYLLAMPDSRADAWDTFTRKLAGAPQAGANS